MGCASSRFSPIEDALFAKSLKTGFEAVSTDEAVGTIRRYALDISGKVNPSQLSLIKSALHLDQVTAGLSPFYASVTETDRLVVAAVLLSNGNAPSKAAALFEVQDRSVAGKLINSEVTDLLTLVFSVVLDCLPLLVASPTEEENAYIGKSREDQANGVRLLKAVLLGVDADMVDRETFVNHWAQYDSGKLLEPAGLRHFIIEPKKA